MKIIVFSDSHGNLRSVKRVLDNIENVDMILHLGDNVRDAIKIKEMTSCPVKYVKGNTDFVEAPMEIIETICHKTFLITHGHKYCIKGNLDRIFYAAKEKSVDIVLFGHSHIPHYEEIEGILFLNPGSIGDKRWEPNETYGVIEIDENGSVQAQIVAI